VQLMERGRRKGEDDCFERGRRASLSAFQTRLFVVAGWAEEEERGKGGAFLACTSWQRGWRNRVGSALVSVQLMVGRVWLVLKKKSRFFFYL